MHALGAAGKQIVWVLNTPELGADVNACLRPAAGEGLLGPPAACSISSASHDARNAAYRDIMLSEIRQWNAERPLQAPAAKVLDPAGVLCEKGRCPLVLDGVPLYRDGDHLSIQGSDLLARWLVPQLPALAP